MTVDIEQLNELSRTISNDTWKVVSRRGHTGIEPIFIPNVSYDGYGNGIGGANARFIVAVRNAWPDLYEEILQLRKEAKAGKELEKEIDGTFAHALFCARRNELKYKSCGACFTDKALKNYRQKIQ